MEGRILQLPPPAEDDPVHALALRVPIEEQRTRRQSEGGGGVYIAAHAVDGMVEKGKEGTGSHLVAIPPVVAGGAADGKEGAGSYLVTIPPGLEGSPEKRRKELQRREWRLMMEESRKKQDSWKC